MGSGAQFHSGCRRAVLAVFSAFAILSALKAHASPWARADGELLLISRAEYFHATLAPELSPDGLVNSEFFRLESNTYVEFGLTEKITIGGKALYGNSWLQRYSGTETANGFTEIEAFAQYQFLQTSTDAASVRLAVARPASFQSGARANQQSNDLSAEAAILYGRNFPAAPFKVFTAVEAGYRKSFGNSADQVRLQTTLGAEPLPRVLVLLEGFSTISMRNEGFGGVDYDVTKLQPSIVYRVGRRLSVQAGMNKEVAGRNLAMGRTFFIGLWSEF